MNLGDDEKEKEIEVEEEVEEVTPVKKEQTRLRGQKKSNLKTSQPVSNTKRTTSKPKSKPSTATSTTTKLSKISKPTTTTKPTTTKPTTKPATTTKPTPGKITTKPIPGKTTTTKTTNPNKINIKTSVPNTTRSGNTNVSKISNTTKPPRRTSQESRGDKDSKMKNLKKPAPAPTSSSVGKRKGNSSVGKRTVPSKNEEVPFEQSKELKNILSKNRVDKVKTETEKSNCLLYIISDYFKAKEIDKYFKNMVDSNPIFKNFSAKINANIKNIKEFTLKKLNGICKFIAIGDKNGFDNFLKIKDKTKSNYETLNNKFNSLLKTPLKNLNENLIAEFCKMILAIPELSVPISKSILKIIE